jgi:uncharacterized protein (DUF2062 family)
MILSWPATRTFHGFMSRERTRLEELQSVFREFLRLLLVASLLCGAAFGMLVLLLWLMGRSG